MCHHWYGQKSSPLVSSGSAHYVQSSRYTVDFVPHSSPFHYSLTPFVATLIQERMQENKRIRLKLAEERALLVQNGSLTPGLRSVLNLIFSEYSEQNAGLEAESLCYTEAARLWYRCGLKLSCLDSILKNRPAGVGSNRIFVSDFIGLLEKVIREDESSAVFNDSPLDITDWPFKVRIDPSS